MRRHHFAIAGGAIVVGSALAAAAYADPNGCPHDFTNARGTGNDFRVEPRLWPTGNDCVGQLPGGGTNSLDMGPEALESLAFIAFAAILLTLATLRPTTLLRGAVLAAVVLAMGGVGSVWFEALLVLLVAGLPLLTLTGMALGVSRQRAFVEAALLWPVVGFGWALFWFAGFGHLAVASGIVAGALGNVALERLGRAGRRIVPANEFATD